jgi:hypothetical protein
MIAHQSNRSVSRRTALAGLGAGGLGVALAATVRHVAAQDATPEELAGHPVVGTWLAIAPPGATVVTFRADGTAEVGWPISYVDPTFPDLDVVFNTPGYGTWEPIGEGKIHFTVVAVLSDAKGTYLGTATLQGYPVVSADGQTFTDNEPNGQITVRDAANHVLADQGGFAPGVAATRMTPNSVVFPPETPGVATPTA